MIRQRREGGSYLIGLLIVIIILGYLTWGYFDKGEGAQSVSTYESSMGRANSAACTANLSVFRMSVATWQIQNPNKTPSIEALKKTMPPIPIPVCHDGGVITIGSNGEVYCSVHSPDPKTQPTPEPAGPVNFK